MESDEQLCERVRGHFAVEDALHAVRDRLFARSSYRPRFEVSRRGRRYQSETVLHRTGFVVIIAETRHGYNLQEAAFHEVDARIVSQFFGDVVRVHFLWIKQSKMLDVDGSLYSIAALVNAASDYEELQLRAYR